MDLESVISKSRDAISVKRVFGEPYVKDELTVIPAAHVRGGGGGGDGVAPDGQQGAGTGFGISARPVGSFVVADGLVRWRPAIDVTRLVIGAEVVAVVALLAIRSIVKARAKVASLDHLAQVRGRTGSGSWVEPPRRR